jgi:hypothetical protein
MPTTDASGSLHKCSKCSAKIFAICQPEFENGSSKVLCRHCLKLQANCKRARSVKPSTASDEDEDFDEAKECNSGVGHSATRTSARPKRVAATNSKSKTAVILGGEIDYHVRPELLITSHVHR